MSASAGAARREVKNCDPRWTSTGRMNDVLVLEQHGKDLREQKRPAEDDRMLVGGEPIASVHLQTAGGQLVAIRVILDPARLARLGAWAAKQAIRVAAKLGKRVRSLTVAATNNVAYPWVIGVVPFTYGVNTHNMNRFDPDLSHDSIIFRRLFRCFERSAPNADTHLSLAGDAPEARAIEPPEIGDVVGLPRVGGLHHRYVRRAA